MKSFGDFSLQCRVSSLLLIFLTCLFWTHSVYWFFLVSIQCQMQNSCIYYGFRSVTEIWNPVSILSWPPNRHINHQRSRICLSYWLCNWKLHDSFVQFYEDTMSIFHRDINRWKMIPFSNSLPRKSIKGFLSIRFKLHNISPFTLLIFFFKCRRHFFVSLL